MGQCHVRLLPGVLIYKRGSSKKVSGQNNGRSTTVCVPCNQHRHGLCVGCACSPKREGTMKYFKEERIGDVIYNLYLKKVRYKRSSPAVLQEEEISHLEWETQKIKVIKAASLEKLVEYLPTAVEMLDSSYINVFFSTYQSFASPKQVLDMLLERYRTSQTTSESEECMVRIQRSIRSVLMMWLDENLDDFNEPPKYPCLQCLCEFAKDSDKELAQRAKLRISQFKEEEKRKNEVHRPLRLFHHDDEVPYFESGNQTYSDFNHVDSQKLAEQLTRLDAELFRRVNPQHCLGSIWSRRDKKNRSPNVTSVKATVNQFNSVCNCVMTTVLSDTGMSPHHRAKLICKWIETAQACREMKNFSSSKAIISGLQTQPVYRLKKAWAAVPKAILIVFDDLASIFMDDNNFEVSREILFKEGTAKFADIESPRALRKPSVQNLLSRRSSEKSALTRRDSGRHLLHGTVPYLGTFLTDLIKIDAAHSDLVEDGLINFEKRRKEFEVIAQIKLLQNSAKNYQFDVDHNFREWFQDINVLDYKECCDISELIEAPPTPVTTPTTPNIEERSTRPKSLRRWLSYSPDDFKNRFSNGSPISQRRSVSIPNHHRTGSSSSSSLSSNSSQDSGNSHDSGNSSLHEAHSHHLDSGISETNESSIERRSSAKCPANGKPDRPRSLTISKSMTDLTRLPISPTYLQSTHFQFPSPDSRIIRVSLGDDDVCNGYKSIVVTDHDHTPSVIRAALDKYNMEKEKVANYTLTQYLPNGPALVLADDANVFYGMNTSVERAMFNLKCNKVTAQGTIKETISLPQLTNIFSKRKSYKKNATEESTYL